MQISLSHFLFLAVGLGIGGIGIWLIVRGKIALGEAAARAAGDVERATIAEQLKAANQRVLECQTRLAEIEQAREALLAEQAKLQSTISGLTVGMEAERKQTQEKIGIINEAREQLSNQFKALANEILEEKSKKFTDQNKTNLDLLLTPLKQQLSEFKTKVEEVYVNEGKDRSALAEQVKQLMQLNNTLSQDAQNLTLALKGDRKAQGNWGEIILEDLLERAGLVRDQHYEVQSSVKTEDGQSHVIPDVVVRLPGDRHLIIDSKMTLPDYRAFACAADNNERDAALKRHLTSMRTHMKGLSEKKYQTLYDLKSLDFVVMFVPLEPAFMLAVTNDRELFQHAWEKNILLVSPSTLLFVIRTVANLWRQEDLSRNAKEISSRGAELYDRLVGFVSDLQNVGVRLDQAQESYNDARRKLSEGRRNVIRQAELLKELGIKPTKTLPVAWVEAALEEPSRAVTSDDVTKLEIAPLVSDAGPGLTP